MTSPKISVVTVCFNAVTIIEETMLSVLNQTYPNMEYIIIDGGSTDGTVDIIRKYEERIAYWNSEPDGGIYDAMNKGIQAALGDWINFMNAGDSFDNSQSVANVVKSINPDTVICMCNWYDVTRKERILRHPLKIEYLKKNIICCHQAILISLSYHRKHLFDTSFKFCADYNLVYKAVYRDRVKVQYIPEVLSCYILDEGFSARNVNKLEREKIRIWNDHKLVNTIKVEMYIFLRRFWRLLTNRISMARRFNQARIMRKSQPSNS
jgi:glycosyltransferase involved in cell wall biosynthesis